MNTKQSRIRRARKTRAKIAAVKAIRLAIHRTNSHIYAQIISADGGTVMTSASSNDKELRAQLANGGNVAAAAAVGKRLAEKAKGFERKLTLVGVGFRAQAQGQKLNLQVGFSHPVAKEMPAGIKVETPTQTEIVIKGMDRQVVGQVAADVRAYRPPEPYKGKGVRYSDEVVIKKETKKK